MPIYNLLISKFILPFGDLFFGGSYLKFVNEWKNNDKKSENELQNLQVERLQHIIKYATEKVPFYKDKGYSSLSDFPILTKQILRDSKDKLISIDYNKETLTEHYSSGSSGIQSFTYMTKEHQFYIRALQTHWWTWSGYKLGDNLLQFGMSQKRTFTKRLKDFFFRCDYVRAFGLTKKELKDVLKRSKKRSKLYISGYPSTINELAKAAHYLNINNVKGVICYGDKLFNGYKNSIKKGFGNDTKLIDTYGCAEGLLIASKKDIDYYYIMSPHVFVEIVDDNGYPLKDGEMGNVLVTCLTNYAMPLIRYRLGDLAIKLPKKDYPENRTLNYPLLKQVVGRETDVVKTKSGIVLNVHAFTGIFEFYQSIKQFKIIQNNLDEIIVEYIIHEKESFDISIITEIKEKFYSLTKNSILINFKEVDIISPTKSGKPQIIASKL